MRLWIFLVCALALRGQGLPLGGIPIRGGAPAGITRVQTTYGGYDGDGENVSTSNFGSSVTAGNWVVVFVRNGANDITSVTDTLGTSYTQVAAQKTNSVWMWCYIGKLASAGTNALTAQIAGSWPWILALELSGAAASSPLDVAISGTQASGTDIVSAAFTTTVAGEYVAMAASQPANTTYTAGTGFTLVNGAFPGNLINSGGVQEYIPTGTLSSYSAHITSVSSSAASTMIVVSLKPAQ